MFANCIQIHITGARLCYWIKKYYIYIIVFLIHKENMSADALLHIDVGGLCSKLIIHIVYS